MFCCSCSFPARKKQRRNEPTKSWSSLRQTDRQTGNPFTFVKVDLVWWRRGWWRWWCSHRFAVRFNFVSNSAYQRRTKFATFFSFVERLAKLISLKIHCSQKKKHLLSCFVCYHCSLLALAINCIHYCTPAVLFNKLHTFHAWCSQYLENGVFRGIMTKSGCARFLPSNNVFCVCVCVVLSWYKARSLAFASFCACHFDGFVHHRLLSQQNFAHYHRRLPSHLPSFFAFSLGRHFADLYSFSLLLDEDDDVRSVDRQIVIIIIIRTLGARLVWLRMSFSCVQRVEWASTEEVRLVGRPDHHRRAHCA